MILLYFLLQVWQQVPVQVMGFYSIYQIPLVQKELMLLPILDLLTGILRRSITMGLKFSLLMNGGEAVVQDAERGILLIGAPMQSMIFKKKNSSFGVILKCLLHSKKQKIVWHIMGQLFQYPEGMYSFKHGIKVESR